MENTRRTNLTKAVPAKHFDAVAKVSNVKHSTEASTAGLQENFWSQFFHSKAQPSACVLGDCIRIAFAIIYLAD